MTVPVNVSFRLDWIQLLKQCRQGFPWLNWRLSVGFILWHHVDDKVAISHIHNSTTSFIPGGKKWKENSLFIHQLNKFWDWISLVRFSSLSFYSLETILLKLTRLGWPSFPECFIFISVVWAQILITLCCCHPLGWLPIILASNCSHPLPPDRVELACATISACC